MFTPQQNNSNRKFTNFVNILTSGSHKEILWISTFFPLILTYEEPCTEF